MLIIGGGRDPDQMFRDGARYDPSLDRWRPMDMQAVGVLGKNPPAVWSGTECLVWGPLDANAPMQTVWRYNPLLDTWVRGTTEGSPTPRTATAAVWTGTEMIIWGGTSPRYGVLSDGRRYVPPPPP